MNRSNVSKRIPLEKSATPPAAGAGDALSSLVQKASGGMAINFHSAEFNRTDDLNDCSGNYRTFQPLDGIVTADMRHQMERQRIRNTGDPAADAAVPRNGTEPDRTEAAVPDDFPPLTVTSRGRTLIIDTDAERALACGRLLDAQGLVCTIVVPKNAGGGAPSPRAEALPLLEVSDVSIIGAFGGFSADAAANGRRRPLSEWLGTDASLFDLVLDLQSTPSFAGGRLPLGYYAPGADLSTLPEVMAELPEMRGLFHRPQFTVFLKDRCLHGRSRTRDCRRCIAVCPSGAIRSAERTIAIDRYRCQGCGGCALVCPAEAIRMVNPPPGELLTALRETLEERPACAAPPTLVISDVHIGGERAGTDEAGRGRLIHFGVEQIGHAGLEMLLAALACGADRVVVACGAQNPPGLREAAEQQANMGRAILRGLDLPEERIRFVVSSPGEVTPEAAGSGAQSDRQPFSLPDSLCGLDKRTLVRLTAQELYDRSGARTPSLALPPGSPFGVVAVDPAACTLCMACSCACPSGALVARGDLPQLHLIESRCHQCGLCEEACPEGAIRLAPRLLCDQSAVEAPALLNEAEPVRCVECGLPFATQAMIGRMKEKLAGHWMYAADRQLRRLHMCRTCRTRDALSSEDLGDWSSS